MCTDEVRRVLRYNPFAGTSELTPGHRPGTGRPAGSNRTPRARLRLPAGRGASKNELFADFKSIPPAQVMEELDHLVRLGALYLEETGLKSIVKAADVALTSRYRATERGKRIAESPKGEELAIEEIV